MLAMWTWISKFVTSSRLLGTSRALLASRTVKVETFRLKISPTNQQDKCSLFYSRNWFLRRQTTVTRRVRKRTYGQESNELSLIPPATPNWTVHLAGSGATCQAWADWECIERQWKFQWKFQWKLTTKERCSYQWKAINDASSMANP